MDILIVEDDEKVGNFLKENLGRENHNIQLITTYSELETFLESTNLQPSLIIMDRLLGNDDTRKLLKKVKQKFSKSSLLYLSALNSPSEKANLLDEGADDYMGKPFSLIELQARVRALLRRSGEQSRTHNGFYLQSGDLLIDLKTRSIVCHGKKLDLTPKEFALLANFCENKNRVYSKFQLLDLIWETNLDIESNVIEVNIMNLRKKLESCNSNAKILSKRNVGYWIET
jgi:DNA-binding response OmpR family regulator